MPLALCLAEPLHFLLDDLLYDVLNVALLLRRNYPSVKYFPVFVLQRSNNVG